MLMMVYCAIFSAIQSYICRQPRDEGVIYCQMRAFESAIIWQHITSLSLDWYIIKPMFTLNFYILNFYIKCLHLNAWNVMYAVNNIITFSVDRQPTSTLYEEMHWTCIYAKKEDISTFCRREAHWVNSFESRTMVSPGLIVSIH